MHIRVLMLLENNSYPNDARPRREAMALIANGYHVTVICPKENNNASKEVVNGVTVYRYDAPASRGGVAGYVVEYGYALIAMFFISLSIALRDGFDIIHAHNPPDLLILIGLFYKPFGKKFIFDHHDLSPELYHARSSDGNTSPILYRMLLFFEKLTFRFSDHIISTNQSYSDIASSRGNVSRSKISIVRNGPLLDRVDPVEAVPDFTDKASILIGYLGAMGFQDGLDYFVRAAHHLIHNMGESDFYAVLVGDGDAVPDLKALIERLQLEDHIHFLGYQPDAIWRPILASVDICIVPDPANPFNNQSTMMKMTDYMALAKPIVAFDLREQRITAGDAALYAIPNDEKEFASQISVLMHDKELRTRMGLIGQERIKRHLSWNHQVPKLIDAYEACTST